MKVFVSVFGALAILLIFMIIFTEIIMMSIASLDPIMQSKIIDKVISYHLVGTNLIALGIGLNFILSQEEW